ncbi:hypothetical protein IWX81_001323 [Salinibacterium sp. CAN_S4]|uniref:cellulase family glycosylhydrolase n=1 Tax=Salinibacterium sp. CAN_S4 TaxID=2787727 RepID=UPI0018EFFD98
MSNHRWSTVEAWAWFETQPWLVGCNYIPRTAVNQLEMWQSATFDLETIDQELGWAAGLGMNTVRVFLHDLLWRGEGEKFLDRVDQFLEIASRHGIRTLVVLFDDCWHDGAKPGAQPPPVPGVHNSRWLQSPGRRAARDRGTWVRLEQYVKAVVGRFRDDDRVLGWDITNEVTNHYLPALELVPPIRAIALTAVRVRQRLSRPVTVELMVAAFGWARSVDPTQPLTAGAWRKSSGELNRTLFELSDIITFHNYEPLSELAQQVDELQQLNRPTLCTEWLARGYDSEIATHIPFFRSQKVGCLNWGLVDGKTQTTVRWKWASPRLRRTLPWFHDLLRRDGTPYREEEAFVLRNETHAANGSRS